MPTIYSVKSDYLLKDADEIERSAKESLKTWILLGQTEKYSEAMRLVRALRDAAETRSLYTRREILRNAGFSIKSPKQTAKDIQGQTRKANPMKKPTPAQLAARARFAEMARSGAFKRKAKARRKSNTLGEAGGRYEILWAGSGDLKASYDDLGQAKDFLDDIDRPPGLFYGRDTKTGKHFFSFAAQTKALKRNPTKKTVSQKISQLVHEGYPQKQAVAVALSEQRMGKVKRNPATGRKASRTKLNPVKYRDIAQGVAPARVQYAVHMPDRPSYHAMAYFTKKTDAVEAAQEVSDRTGKPVAVSRVQVHFGPL